MSDNEHKMLPSGHCLSYSVVILEFSKTTQEKLGNNSSCARWVARSWQYVFLFSPSSPDDYHTVECEAENGVDEQGNSNMQEVCTFFILEPGKSFRTGVQTPWCRMCWSLFKTTGHFLLKRNTRFALVSYFVAVLPIFPFKIWRTGVGIHRSSHILVAIWPCVTSKIQVIEDCQEFEKWAI